MSAPRQSRKTLSAACEYVCWPPEQHRREAEELIATADTLFALSDYQVTDYEIPAV
jgi:hypothetical protein